MGNRAPEPGSRPDARTPSPATRPERRLAAILAADVAGYSRLVERDEQGTLARLKAHRKGLVEPLLAAHRGRTVKLMGDGALCEFASVVDAVACAVAVQRGMEEREAGVPEAERLRLRIGVNLGDVVVEGDDLYGDGVNIAARLEGLAEPGGLCISRAVRDQVRDRLPYPFEDQGERPVKNIARPLRVFALPAAAIAALPKDVAATALAAGGAGRRRRLVLGAAGLLAAALMALGGTWWLRVPPSAPAAPPAVLAPAPAPAPPRLSIVVLPFTNLGADPEQEYLADGLTDDLTTDLSRVSGSFVIARNTAFTYKGRPVDTRQVGRELGVRYILEGSVRRDGDRVRVNARLVDADSGADLWAERFEHDRADLAGVQDEITGRIAAALRYELIDIEGSRSLHGRGADPDAVELAMRGWSTFYRQEAREVRAEARDLFEQALRRDDRLVTAWAGLALTRAEFVTDRWSADPTEELRQAEAAATRALGLDPKSAEAHYAWAKTLREEKRFELAADEFERAIALNGNLADAHANLGLIRLFMGRPREAFAPVEEAMRLSPRDPNLSAWRMWIGMADMMLGRDDEAVAWLEKSVSTKPRWGQPYYVLAGACALTGRDAEARAALAEYDRLRPGMTIGRMRAETYSDNPVYLAWRERLYDGLRRAGMPEG